MWGKAPFSVGSSPVDTRPAQAHNRGGGPDDGRAMTIRTLWIRTALVATPLALTTASLIALIIASIGVEVCGFPDFTLFFSFHLLFSLGFVWLGSSLGELIVPRVVAMPLAVGLYFAVGRIGLTLARTVSDPGDHTEVSAWIPFWLVGVFLSTDLLPGSC
jgi:hypothetical protein